MIRLFWRVIYPIVLYTVINIAVFLMVSGIDTLTITMISALFAAAGLGFLFSRDQQERGQKVCNGGISLKQVVLTAVFGIGSCIAVNNFIEIGKIGLLFPGFNQVAVSLYSPPLWIQFLAIGFVIPIAEELVFRALGFARIRDQHGYWLAAVVSSLIFALYHGNMVQGIYAFILGLCMCRVYECTGSILSPILFHQSANLTSIILNCMAGYEEVFGAGIPFYSMTLAATGVMAVSYILIKKNVQKNVQKEVQT